MTTTTIPADAVTVTCDCPTCHGRSAKVGVLMATQMTGKSGRIPKGVQCRWVALAHSSAAHLLHRGPWAL